MSVEQTGLNFYSIIATMATALARESLRGSIFGHGALIILSALIGGLGLWCFLLGSFELIPDYIVKFNLPRYAPGWVRCHTGPMAIGFMVILTGLHVSVVIFNSFMLNIYAE